MRRTTLSNVVIAGMAAAAMPVAHVLAFYLAAPDAHSRAHLLSSTGHRYWLPIACAGLFGGVLALAGFVRSHLASSGTTSGLVRSAALRLAPFQIFSFLLLEMVERTSIGHTALSALEEPVVLIGVVLQLLVALAAGLLLRAVVDVVAALKRRSSVALRPERQTSFTLWDSEKPRLRPDVTGSTLRGPPLSQQH